MTEGRQQERSLADGEATIHTAAGQATGPLVDVSEGGLKVRLIQFDESESLIPVLRMVPCLSVGVQ